MYFNSLEYILFLPLVTLIYFLIPKKVRYVWLLIVSYYFYMSWNAEYGLLLLASTLITYASGLLIAHFKKRNSPVLAKTVLAVCAVLNIGALVYFKYMNFIMENLSAITGAHFNSLDILLPVGISFFIFQALGYAIDCYRGDIDAEKNPLKYALFVSFFPQLVAGPIERSKNLLTQIRKPTGFDADNCKNGLKKIAWGLLLKMVIADNLAIIVNRVYANYTAYSGIIIVLATALFAFQIYCDFSGYSIIALGSAQILGFKLMRNFDSPYMATNIRNFWRRWHISLTTWFTDYLYKPLGGNRKGKTRQLINTMIVFLVSGIWHGASWTFVIWGALNGIFIVIHSLTQNFRTNVYTKLKINTDSFGHRFIAVTLNFFIVCFTWLFFRAETLSDAAGMIKHSLSTIGYKEIFSGALWQNLFQSPVEACAVLLSLALLIFTDVLRYKKVDIESTFSRQNGLFRTISYIALVLALIVFGIYGGNYETQFIYFQF